MAYPVPLLTFNDPRGLDLARFNTIRLGAGWHRRLKQGQRVLLATKFEVIGSAKIAFLDIGPLDYMLELYAKTNHVELGSVGMQGYDDGLAAVARRMESVIKNYGQNRVWPGVKVTVIGLKR